MMLERLVFVLFALCLGSVSSLIHHLTIEGDERELFKIETFGFDQGGVMELKITNFKLEHPPGEPTDAKGEDLSKGKIPPVGFVMRRSDSESEAEQDIENTIEAGLCPFTAIEPDDILIDISMNDMYKRRTIDIQHDIVEEDEVGLYTLLFARCPAEYDGHKVSFTLDVIFKNKASSLTGDNGWDYLSAGDRPLPVMYGVFFCLFGLAFLVWLSVLRRDPAEYGTVHKIHYLMAALLALKCATLLTESVRYHTISTQGVTGFMSLLYYIFSAMRGVMLFTVILLIGSGWSIMRSFLHTREKKIVLVVLVAQVINGVAMVVLEETAPGSQQWADWRFALHMFDLACCCAILVPIVWSIKHLREAVEADGKAQNMLAKLRLFRSFYLMVVSYVYFTRIVVFLVEAVVPFHLEWVGPFCLEFATLVFYTATGFKFQPALDNPYLSVSADDDDDMLLSSSRNRFSTHGEGEEGGGEDGEYGLDDSDDEGQSRGLQLTQVTRSPMTVEV